ncbi:tetratricopeptide repeat protein [Colwellia sp. 4_MG-2023]|uniref:nSTAND1 domain-containing NTPase n=1 Tax=unclassified Colwellia TaxID=196834 RepID=UPI0026E2E1DE|nr:MULTISPECIES: tetratricopeptide repeat protein [unclassified Colwellia]MDO6505372.1 tetratricopeptide repeat protein [Colwellia sp. 5_MG-2023]MDO6554332.1 tetratricopeptide repeat protein [Colwellia sp. 4_MG-2023]
MASKDQLNATDKQYSFTLGEWAVDSGSNQLISKDNSFTIEPKMMDVLIYLCQNAGQTISAEQLLIACWSGTFYGDAPVQKCIAGLRKKLGCNAKQPIYIETIYRRGYRIISDVVFKNETSHFAPRQSLTQWTHGSPYMGLNTFDESHTPIYFGRTKAIAEVIQSLKHCIERRCHFLLLLGKSGSGKSSLIRAGVLPYLNSETGFAQLRVKQHHIITPNQSIHESPTATIINALSTLSLLKPDIELTNFIKEVEQTPRKLTSGLYTKSLVQNGLVHTGELTENIDGPNKVKNYQLLVIDQFEQFLLDDNLDTRLKENLVLCIKQLAQCENLLCIAMLRNDFYAECIDVNGFPDLKDNGRQYDLQAASPIEITRMIRNPAIAAGLTFEKDEISGEQLDEILLAAAVKNHDALPLLEYTLDLLYQQRSKDNKLLLSVYHDMGGMEGAIAQQAEITFNLLSPSAQKCWDSIMHALVKIDYRNKQSITARKAPIAIFVDPAEKQFIQSFLDAHLFVTILQTSTGEQRYFPSKAKNEKINSEVQFITIAHEALLKHWHRISKWVNENSEAIYKREQLADDCLYWLESNKSTDTLLNSKQKILDDIELSKRSGIHLNANEIEFISKSKRHESRKNNFITLFVLVMIGFSLLTWYQSRQVGYERDVALYQSKKADAIATFLTNMFKEIQPQKAKGKEVLVKDILVKASENITADNALKKHPEIDATIQTVIAGIYIDLGLLDAAEKHLTTASIFYNDTQLKQTKEYLNFLNQYIRFYGNKFEFNIQLPLIKESITLSKELYGEKSSIYLGYLSNLGGFYQDTGSLEKAKIIYTQVYEKRKNLFGNKNKDSIRSLNQLGTIAYWLGDYEEAKKMYNLCIENSRVLLGEYDPLTLVCSSSLGSLYEAMGQYQLAVPMIKAHIQHASVVFGERHITVLRSMHNLADSYRGLGKVAEAERLFRKTLQLRQDILGQSHIETLQTQMKFSRLLRLNASYDEARPLIEDTVKKLTSKLGIKHPTTLTASQELANLYLDSNQLDKALSLYQEGLNFKIEVLGEHHPELRGPLIGLARFYLLTGDSDKAEIYLTRCLTIMKENKNITDEELIKTLNAFIIHFTQTSNNDKQYFYQKVLASLQ